MQRRIILPSLVLSKQSSPHCIRTGQPDGEPAPRRLPPPIDRGLTFERFLVH